jgi:hypothetical protein
MRVVTAVARKVDPGLGFTLSVAISIAESNVTQRLTVTKRPVRVVAEG